MNNEKQNMQLNNAVLQTKKVYVANMLRLTEASA